MRKLLINGAHCLKFGLSRMGTRDVRDTDIFDDTGDKDPNTHQAHTGYIGSTDNK